MRVQLPEFCTADTFQIVLAQVFDEHAKPRTNAYLFDFSTLKKVDYWSWIGLANLCLWLESQQIRVSATPVVFDDGVAFPFSKETTAQYLYADEESRHLTARRIAAVDVVAWLQEMFIPWLLKEAEAGSFLMNSLYPFKNLCSYMSAFNREVLIGASYQSKTSISLWMAGFGPDLPAIGRQALAYSVSDLIALAFLTEGGHAAYRSRKHETHLGIVLHELVAHHWGKVEILSGFADFTYAYTDQGLRKQIGLSHGYCPGFIAEFQMPVARAHALSLLNEPSEQRSLAI